MDSGSDGFKLSKILVCPFVSSYFWLDLCTPQFSHLVGCAYNAAQVDGSRALEVARKRKQARKVKENIDISITSQIKKQRKTVRKPTAQVHFVDSNRFNFAIGAVVPSNAALKKMPMSVSVSKKCLRLVRVSIDHEEWTNSQPSGMHYYFILMVL